MNAQRLPRRRLCGGERVTLAAQWTSRAERRSHSAARRRETHRGRDCRRGRRRTQESARRPSSRSRGTRRRRRKLPQLPRSTGRKRWGVLRADGRPVPRRTDTGSAPGPRATKPRQRRSTRQRLSNSSRVFGRRLPSRRLRRSWEIARSCSGIAKPSSFRPPSEAGIAKCRALPKSVGERHGEGEAKARLVELVDRDDHEGPGLGLLPASRWIGVGPVDVALPGLRLYHSGVGASKLDSSSSLSAR